MHELFDEKDTTQIKAKVPPKEIVFIDMIFKSYEGLADLTVSSHEEGIIYLNVTKGTKKDVLDILDDLKEDFSVEVLEK